MVCCSAVERRYVHGGESEGSLGANLRPASDTARVNTETASRTAPPNPLRHPRARRVCTTPSHRFARFCGAPYHYLASFSSFPAAGQKARSSAARRALALSGCHRVGTNGHGTPRRMVMRVGNPGTLAPLAPPTALPLWRHVFPPVRAIAQRGPCATPLRATAKLRRGVGATMPRLEQWDGNVSAGQKTREQNPVKSGRQVN